MGKAQSKRSVDITTEGKKDEEVLAGKVEKIEDAEDQKPQVNGDATPQEGDAKEKKENEESENDKDATTEKGTGADADGGGGDATTQNGEQSGEEAAKVATTPKEEAKEGGEVAEGAEEAISPLADDSSKKTKKEKVKKKWSFRSISFGKKDKQKPAKTEGEATSPTTNGEAADKTAEGANGDEAKIDEGTEAGTKTTTATENGEASEKELLNGGGETTTTTPTDEKSNAAGTNESTNDTAATVAAATTNNTTASSSTTTSPSTAPVAGEIQTENKVAADVVVTPVLSNGTAEDIKEIVEKPQQNGTNGEGHADDEEETHVADIKVASKSIEFEKKIEHELASGDGANAGADASTGAGEGDALNSQLTTKTIADDIGAGGDIGEIKQNDKLVEPPPLPISPPPSQVVVFALNNEVPASDALNHFIEEKLQSSIVPIAEEEEEFVEKSEEKIDTKSQEIPIINIVEEQTELKQNDTLPIADAMAVAEDEPYKEVEATATATFLVDEITAKASNIVTEMNNVLQKQHEELVEDILQQQREVDEEEDDELPPPPPTPPSETAENGNDVEEVLNQFESKMNEIEKKVMSFELNSSADENEDEDRSFDIWKNCVIHEVNLEPMSINDFINQNAEELKEANEIKPTENVENGNISHETETNKIECSVSDDLTESNNQQQHEKEQNGKETSTVDKEQNGNETSVEDVEMYVTASNNEEEQIENETYIVEKDPQTEKAEIDVTSIIVDEINKLSLNDIIVVDSQTSEYCTTEYENLPIDDNDL